MRQLIFLLTFTLASTFCSFGQTKGPLNRHLMKKKPSAVAGGGTFGDTQWWLGFKMGANYTGAIKEAQFSTFGAIDSSDKSNAKSYANFENIGVSAGVDFSFYYKDFSLSFQPNYRRQRFSYANHYEWTDPEDADNFLELNFSQDHNLDYLELPLLIKYNFLEGKFRPFVQIGGYYGYLIDATKKIEISGIDRASGQANNFQNENLTVGADDLFIKTSLGLIGGVGVNYYVQNIRLSLDISYRYGLHNIANAQNRFTDNRLAGIGDALDDISLRNISTTIGVMFPMKYLSDGFSAIK